MMGRKKCFSPTISPLAPRVLLSHPPSGFCLLHLLSKGPRWLSNPMYRRRGSQGSWSCQTLLSLSGRQAGLCEIPITYFPLSKKTQVIRSILLEVWDSGTSHLNKSTFQLTMAQRPDSCGLLFLGKWEMKASRINKASKNGSILETTYAHIITFLPLRVKSGKTTWVSKALITDFKRFGIELSYAFTYNEEKNHSCRINMLCLN